MHPEGRPIDFNQEHITLTLTLTLTLIGQPGDSSDWECC